MNSNKTFKILLILLVCLGAYVYYMDPVSHDIQLEQDKALNFKIGDVQEILLKKKEQVLLFRKNAGKWMIAGCQVDTEGQAMINGLISTFDLGIVDVVESRPSDHDQYGLDHPEVEFGIKVKGGGGFRHLLLGRNSVTNTICYAKNKDGKEVMFLGILYKKNMEDILEKFRLEPKSCER